MENTKDLLQQALEQHQAGNLTDAVAIYLKIYEENPQHVDVLFLLGTSYLQSGNTDAAARFLQKAITLKPDHVEAHNNLGTVFQNCGNLRKR